RPRGRGAAGARRRRSTARRLHLLLGLEVLGRGLVFGEPPLQHGAREDADETSAFDDRHALEILVLEHAKGLVEIGGGLDREEGWFRDLTELRRSGISPR